MPRCSPDTVDTTVKPGNKDCFRPAGTARARGPLVFACDGGYAMQLATALRSLAEAGRAGWPLDIHILADGFSPALRRQVAESLPPGAATLAWIEVDPGRFGEFWTMRHVSRMTFARLLIPALFPETVEKVLYLDADILVLDDLGPLWEMDLQDAVLGAVLDAFDPELKRDPAAHRGVPRVADYFNAGVLLIDLVRWRQDGIAGRALDYLRQHPQSPFSDQDALNVACDGRWHPLPARWNFQGHRSHRITDIAPGERPGIVHFVSGVKPWKADAGSVNAGFYDGFRSRTRFARTPADRLADAARGIWSRLLAVVKRLAFVRAVRGWLAGRRTAGGDFAAGKGESHAP